MIKNFFNKHWPLIIIFLLGLVPLFWFRQGHIIAGGDQTFYLDPSANLYNYSYSWYDKLDGGMPSLEKPKVFPMSLFWFLGKKIGFSLPDIQKSWIVLHFILPGIFMYFLVRYFFRESEKRGAVAGLVGAVLYMFNFLVIVDGLQVVLRPVIAFLPLIFLFWIKGLSQEKFSFKYPSMIAISTLLYGSANLNFASTSPIYIILGAYFIYFLLTTKKFIFGFAFLFFTSILFILINMWWLPNFYFSLVKIDKNIIEVVRSYDFLKSTPINEAFRTMGFWAFLQQFNNKTLLPFAMSYYRFPLLVITFFIPIFSFSGLLFRNKTKEKIFFSLLALLGIFLAKGTNYPFGFIFQFFYDKVPGFSMYREPFAKFTIIHLFSFSVLLGLFIEDLSDFLFRHKGKTFFQQFLPYILIFIILISSYPLLTGKNIQNETWYGDSRYSLHTKVPEYWHEAGNWFKQNNSNLKVLLSPKIYYGHTYGWESGISSGEPAALYLIPNPLIRAPSYLASGQNRLSQLVYQTFFLGKNTDLTPYLNLFAVDYVLQQNDITPNNEAGIFDPYIMSDILKNQKSLKQIINFGQLTVSSQDQVLIESINALDVYSVVPGGSLLQVYSPDKLVIVDGKLESYFDLFSFYQYRRGDGYHFLSEENSISDEIKKIDENTLYFINLKEKQKINKENGEMYFDIEILKEGSYQLLINEYLFKPEFNKESASYYLFFNNNKLPIPQEKSNQWRSINIDMLKPGYYSLKTNLPVNEIKPDYLTSPFWLIEDKKNAEKSLVLSNRISAFKKINPSKYEVNIENTTIKPYLLVLSESFNPLWQIYSDGKKISADHFLANGYANGWYLTPENTNNEKRYMLEIKYLPQMYADIGNNISLITIFSLLGYLVFTWSKFNKK